MARRNTVKSKKEVKKDHELLMFILIVVFIALSIIAYSRQGVLGIFFSNFVKFAFGEYAYTVLLVLIILFLGILIDKKKVIFSRKTVVAAILLLSALFLYSALEGIADSEVGFVIFESYLERLPDYFGDEAVLTYGGVIGALLLSVSTILFAKAGTYVVVVALVAIGILILIPLSAYKEMWLYLKKFFALPEKIMDFGVEDDEYEDDDYEVVEKPRVVQTKFAGVLDDKYEHHEHDNFKSSIFMDVDPEINKKDKIEIVEKASEPTLRVVDYNKPVEDKPYKKMEAEKTEVDEVKNVSKTNNGEYILPNINILDAVSIKSKSNANSNAAKEKGIRLLEILKNFGIDANLIATHIGPSVTKYEIKPDSNVKVSKIISIQDNIKMELAARDIRIEAPIPGRNAIGIEIPNVETTPVKMKEIVSDIPMDKRNKPLLLALGKDLLGKSVFCQLDKMPHLLIAGATGSGKSVCMNAIITSLLLRTTPDEVKLLLVDPKKVEFTPYANIPHLIGPVINDSTQANNALKVIVQIMDERYDIFSLNQVRNIQAYNEKVKKDPTEAMLKPLPYIVVIIDELADLMAVAGKEVEVSIQRITQLARAAGIHLIVATQRPSTDVITGIIKANIPSRIAFSVSSGIDSRTILDQVGAERLLGYGDMLYFPIGEPSSLRLQGVYVTDDEVSRIAEFCSSQRRPMYDDAFVRLEGIEGNDGTAIIQANEDPLYIEIKEYVVEVQKASTSLLQRRFGIGYNRAARMIDVLEQNGVIGPAQGSKPRDVYLKKEDDLI